MQQCLFSPEVMSTKVRVKIHIYLYLASNKFFTTTSIYAARLSNCSSWNCYQYRTPPKGTLSSTRDLTSSENSIVIQHTRMFVSYCSEDTTRYPGRYLRI